MRLRKLSRGQPEIAELLVRPAHLGWVGVIRAGESNFERLLAQAELDRLVQRGDASLQQGADLGDLVSADLAEQRSQQRRQLQSAGRLFQLFEARGQDVEREHRSRVPLCGTNAGS